MPVNLKHRDFLKELDFTEQELQFLLDLSRDLKRAKYTGNEVQRMRGKNVALIFEKTSTRTRCAFEVGAYDQGAHVTYLDPTGSQLGHKESIADTGAVLAGFYDGIEYRGSAHSNVEELAAASGVPVWNGLTNEWHPTQMLADFLTMTEHSRGRAIQDVSYCYMGDARSNMGNSLLVMGAIMGADVRVCGPKHLWPSKEVQDAAKERAALSGARVLLTDDPKKALPGADFVMTDVWVSMGEPADVWNERIKLLKPYQVNAAALNLTGKPNVKFMHCLPAFHDTNTHVGQDIAAKTGMNKGLEVTDEVFQSSANIAFQQAENRLHTIKAIMVATIGD
ncbi:MAG: ornithine carbamoyltransferase [Candidatus Nanopelagicales bacterium]|nr:ornithine carbamoyltransferase [Candidatus Nanopelagicales bacterium]MDZ4249095.1 ornithine carbamoyltransferase [Candidatus Nanopelagicales bacterium]